MMIEAVFSNRVKSVRTKNVYQWDYGQVLRISGLDLPTATEVHFAIDGASESVTRVAIYRDHVADVVIPDSMLEQTSPIVAYIYLTDSESGQTVYEIHTSIKARPKPEAFDKPEEAELFREAIRVVNSSVDRASEAETSAAADADRAESAATIAEQAKKDAEVSAKKAQEFTDSIHTDLTEVTNEVSELKESVSKVNNATEIPATAGKVWTSTENGAGWADPQGGSGIAVTGATVGQTVKIAAVDENGVPTAWEPVDFPAGGEAITAPVDIIASGTIPAGTKEWKNIGDIGVTWGDLKQYKSIGILFNNGTDWPTLNLYGMDSFARIQISAGSCRFYTIFHFVDSEKSKIQFSISAGPESWFVNEGSVKSDARWSSNAFFNPSIIQVSFIDNDKLSFILSKDTTVDSTWYLIGLTR